MANLQEATGAVHPRPHKNIHKKEKKLKREEKKGNRVGKEIVISDQRLCTRLHGFNKKCPKMFKGGAHTELGQPDDGRELFLPLFTVLFYQECASHFYHILSILYYIPYSNVSTPAQYKPTRPDPTRRGLTRSDATRPGPTRLHSSPDSSQNEGRITRPCTLSDFNCTIT